MSNTNEVEASTNETNLTTSNKEVGYRLLGFRENLKLSQRQMADSVGVSLSAYQNYERGDRSITKEVICALMGKYELDPAWLLSGAGCMQRHASIDDNLLEEIACEFEMSYKATVEKNETAFWIRFHELFPEETKGRPFDEDIEQVMDAVNKRGRIARLISNIYNKSIEKQDKELRAAFISNMITASVSFCDRSNDIDPEEFANEVESINIEKRITAQETDKD